MIRKYTTKDIVDNYKISESVITARARKLDIKPFKNGNLKKYLFTEAEVLDIVNYQRKHVNVMFATQVWWIIESKINNME
jgi:hypothetical protein